MLYTFFRMQHDIDNSEKDSSQQLLPEIADYAEVNPNTMSTFLKDRELSSPAPYATTTLVSNASSRNVNFKLSRLLMQQSLSNRRRDHKIIRWILSFLRWDEIPTMRLTRPQTFIALKTCIPRVVIAVVRVITTARTVEVIFKHTFTIISCINC